MTTGVVNTIPEATLLAFADHGQVSGDTISNTYRASDLVLNTIDSVGIDYVQSMNQLEQEGLQKFDASWAQLIETVDASLQEHR